MTKIYTLTLAPSLDSATQTVDTVETHDWTRQNLHVHVNASGEQYRFVMPGAALTKEELQLLEEKVLAIAPGSLLVISGSLPPGISVDNLTQLVKNAQQHGLRCIVDSSGDALAAALDVGNIELVKPNQKELSALVQRDLTQPDDVRLAAQELIRSGKVQRVVVSLGAQGALGVDAQGSVQVVPPPMKSQSTVGAGDSMVGAMTLRLAENASLEDMVRFGVAAGSAATINQGTRLCSLDNTQKIYHYLRG